tara:strand:+ start:15923 stop:17041 length:1119 start_codon:yes stop_codon:yes gene_type:complete
VHIVYFFTYGYSIKSWESAGILSRELKIFDKLIEDFGLKFTFVTYGDNKDKEFKLNKNIKIVPIYSLINKSENKYKNLYSSFKLSKLLKNEIGNFDVIKQNQLLGSWASILLKLNSKKPLYTRTGYDMFLFSLKEKKSIFKIFLYYLLTQLTLIFSNIYSITNKLDSMFLKKYFLVNKKKLVIRPNWVSNENYKNFNLRYENKILSVGRLEKQKNFEYLIKCLVNTNLTLDIVGSGSEQENLEKISENLAVNVNFLGTVENNQLLKLMAEYKYFVSTSSFEGNPKAILEAMASGCVVIAKDIPNNVEIINNKVNGILFNEHSMPLQSLLKNINTLDDEQNLSENGIEYIKKNNSIEELANNIYQDIQLITSK